MRQRHRMIGLLEESSKGDEKEHYASDWENDDLISVRSRESDICQEESDSKDDIPLQQ